MFQPPTSIYYAFPFYPIKYLNISNMPTLLVTPSAPRHLNIRLVNNTSGKGRPMQSPLFKYIYTATTFKYKDFNIYELVF